MTPHPRYEEFKKNLKTLQVEGIVRPWQGIMYRFAPTKFSASKLMMSGAGAFKAGARWNAPRTFHVVYCASSPELATTEYFAGARLAGLPLQSAMPLTGKAFQARLDTVVDLRDKRILKRIGVKSADILTDNWRDDIDAGRESLCQAIGRAAHDCEFDALIVESRHARDSDDFNIVLLIENASQESGKWNFL